MSRFTSLWVSIRSSLWFVPTTIVAGSIALAVVLVELEKYYDFQWASEYPLLFGAGAEGSRGMLSTIAGSMITVAGVTFSLTISALVTASGQYTSRILRNFMRDRSNQFVLGAFVGIFAYCLVVLRTIRGGGEATFVPSFAVFVGLLLSLLGIGVLVFFIHHIATSIQASTIIARITEETLSAIEIHYPGTLAEAHGTREAVPEGESPFRGAVEAAAMGYVQRIDTEAILDIGREHGAVVSMNLRPGEFVAEGAALMWIDAGATVDDGVLRRLRSAVSIRRFRTIDEEFSFGIRQLVDIAIKALSPGINDTTTAIMCIDHLGAVLGRLASREMPLVHRSADGRAVLFTRGPGFDDILDSAIDQIRNSAGRNVAVLTHLVRAITSAATCTASPSRSQCLEHHLRLVVRHADGAIAVDHDRALFATALDGAIAALGAVPTGWIAMFPARFDSTGHSY